MLTEKDYCDYDTCVALKELGYNEKSNWWFNKVLNEEYDQMQLVHICDNPAHLNYDSWGICPKDFVIRPTMWEAQKFLREEKKLIVLVGFDFCPFTSEIVYNWVIVVNGNTAKKSSYTYDYFEEALLEGVRTSIEILKEE